jgi:hypothetical protein
MKQGPTHPRHNWAVSYVEFCPDEGPRFYAGQWRAAAADTAALEQLVFYSARIRDGRIYTATDDAARDGSRPVEVRLAAMLLLAKYVDPANGLSIASLTPPDSISHIPLRTGWRTDTWAADGAEPLGPVAANVATLLRSIAANRTGEPRAVWYAAAVLARRVESDIAHGRAQ